MQGRYLFSRRNDGDLETALDFFERAVELDPDNAAAWVGMAPLYLWLFDPPRQEDSLKAAEKALSLEPENPEAWSRKAVALYTIGEKQLGDEAWETAQKFGENNVLIQSQIAGPLLADGDIEGAIAAQEYALSLDPLHQVNIANLAHYYIADGHYDEAEKQARKLVQLSPNGTFGKEILTILKLLRGKPEELQQLLFALENNQQTEALSGFGLDWWLAMTNFSLGNLDESNAALEQFIDNEGDITPHMVAEIYAWRGEVDNAFEWLEKSVDSGEAIDFGHLLAPWFNSLKDDPRWQPLFNKFRSGDF